MTQKIKASPEVKMLLEDIATRFSITPAEREPEKIFGKEGSW